MAPRRSSSSATGPNGCGSRGGRCAIPRRGCRKWAQGRGLPTPIYREVERTGPHHDPQFRVAVDLPGLAPAEGVGGSKRAAEKVAASVMIEREGVSGGSNDG